MTPNRRATTRLLHQLVELRDGIGAESAPLLERWQTTLRGSSFAGSAANLAAYLALRRRDLRRLQHDLATLGLSSLGRCEAHVLATLDAVIANLALLGGERRPRPRPAARQFQSGARLIEARAVSLLGPRRDREVRILVTLPATAATDRRWVNQLIAAGTDAVRINCAHDGPEVWSAMIRNARRARRAAPAPW
jgi:pyruvate kinase